jgi:hypothetical protein
MKIIWRLFAVALLVTIVSTPIFISEGKGEATSSSPNVYVGVTYGGTTVAGAEKLIDEVKSYTNLFVVASWEISGAPNSTALDEICDYAVEAGLSIIVYFSFIYYNYTFQFGNFYNSSSWEIYGVAPWHIDWLNQAKTRWGDKFLGVYLYDEPGGKQIDTGYWGGNTTTRTGFKFNMFANVKTYAEAATTFTQGILRSGSMQHVINSTISNSVTSPLPVFTSDYALYWFNYEAGYNTVFVELGNGENTNSKIEQIALCRGAADAQGKQWGAIITWGSDNPPTPESGPTMLKDMTMAYDAGAKYIVAFDYEVNGKGGLTNQQFNAIKQFWNNIYSSSSSDSQGKYYGQVALVLPNDYGWGMRTPTDKIWGLWPADNKSAQIWNNMNQLVDKYGLNLDIVYQDPQVSIQGKYSQTYPWNSTLSFAKGNSNFVLFEPYILVASAISVGSVACTSTYLVMKRRKQKPAILYSQAPIASAAEPKRPVKIRKASEFNLIFDAFADTTDSLFDLLIGLHRAVNCDHIKNSLKLAERAIVDFLKVAKVPPEKVDFQNLSAAVKMNQIEEAANQSQFILESLYDHVALMGARNESSEEVQSDYNMLKSAISAYFMFNDILLGQTVGDKGLGKEKRGLRKILSSFPEGAQTNVYVGLFAEITDRLRQGKTDVTAIAESRALLRKQLIEFLYK